MMAKENINEASAYTLAGLVTDLMQKLRKGVRTLQDLIWFLNLSQKDLADFQGRKILATLNKLFKEITTLFEKVSPNNNYVDSDITRWFDSEKVNSESGELIEETGEYPLSINTKHNDVVSYLKDNKKYLEMTLLQGLQEIIKRTKNGYFDKKATYLVIPISTLDKDGNKCVLVVSRSSDGELCVRVSRGVSENVWYAGFVFLTRNKTLKS